MLKRKKDIQKLYCFKRVTTPVLTSVKEKKEIFMFSALILAMRDVRLWIYTHHNPPEVLWTLAPILKWVCCCMFSPAGQVVLLIENKGSKPALAQLFEPLLIWGQHCGGDPYMIGSEDMVKKSGWSPVGGFCLVMKLLLLSIHPKRLVWSRVGKKGQENMSKELDHRAVSENFQY